MKNFLKKIKLMTLCFTLAISAFCLPMTVLAGTEMYYYPNANSQGAWTLSVKHDDQVWEDAYDSDGNEKEIFFDDVREITVAPGYHKYGVEVTGNIEIARWNVMWPSHLCIHGAREFYVRGLKFCCNPCGKALSSGWWPTCMDCGEQIKLNFYSSENELKEVKSFPANSYYYSVCSYPECGNTEQAAPIEHFCRSKVSANRYTIVYDANGGNGGYMADSVHYTDDATEYEGKEVTPTRNLSKNAYTKRGFYFTGWNTKRDGSGERYGDEEFVWTPINPYIKNKVLSSSNETEITLYAQWKRCSSTLSIDANGGTYDGQSVYDVTKDYSETYDVDPAKLNPPTGYTLFLNSGSYGHAVDASGIQIDRIVGTKKFKGWAYDTTFQGKFNGRIYTFLRTTQPGKDILTAQYESNSFTLPDVKESDPGTHNFGGWFYDPECKRPAGKAGDQISISSDTTIYAGYSALTLNSVNNYSANNGKGAVDLSWYQNDTTRKSYEIFQTSDANVATRTSDTQLANEWTRITAAADDYTPVPNVATTFTKVGESQTIKSAFSGIFHIDAYGASGSSYGNFNGGKGGYVGGDIYLEKGETLTIVNGGAGSGVNSGGYNGGGTGSTFGNGGGMTTVTSDIKGLLFIAGGGGAATDQEAGHDGGMEQSLVAAGSNGENGYAGGGAGYRGGSAGENIVHNHSSDCYINATKNANEQFYKNSNGGYTGYSHSDALTYNDTKASVYFHTAADEGSTCYLRVGDAANYFRVPSAGTLTFNASASTRGGYPPSQNVITTVYFVHGDGTIESQTMNVTKDFTTKTPDDYMERWGDDHRCSPYSIYLYNLSYFTGSLKTCLHESWQKDDGRWTGAEAQYLFSGTYQIDVPEEVVGVYFAQDFTVVPDTGDSTGAWVSNEISNITYSYSQVTCGYSEGEVVSSKPAYGGSNYCNTSYIYNGVDSSGEGSGDGYVVLTPVHVGFLEVNSLNDVAAPDVAEPDPIPVENIKMSADGEFGRKFVWTEPKDNGTDYYHCAISYYLIGAGATRTGLTSNVTINNLLTGIKGYYYLVNSDSAYIICGNVNEKFVSQRTDTTIDVKDLFNGTYYFHIAAIDNAGNIAATTHYPFVISPTDELPLTYSIATGQISVSGEDDNLYQISATSFYVRADDITPITFENAGWIQGNANLKYQINVMRYNAKNNSLVQQIKNQIPFGTTLSKEYEYSAVDLQVLFEAPEYFRTGSYTKIWRQDNCKKVLVQQRLIPNKLYDAQSILITPSASAYNKETDEIMHSVETEDAKNGVTLIFDGKEPNIAGTEYIDQIENAASRSEMNDIILTATDETSGLKKLTVTLLNKDNYIEKTWESTEGNITIPITDDQMFNGKLSFTVTAEDNVGNKATYGKTVESVDFTTSLQKELPNHDRNFKAGQAGFLYLTSVGYIDKLVIEFPEELEQIYSLNYDGRMGTTIIYDFNDYGTYTKFPDLAKTGKIEDKYEFWIPIYTQPGTYRAKITPYKNGEKLDRLIRYEEFYVDGDILNDFKTTITK